MCFRSGPTRYYFFYGGTRHYYGTRTWNQCNGHCDQSVYLDQASWTINAVGGTPPQFSGYETPNQIKRAISAQWIGVNQNLIQVTCASTTCSVQVMLPDGSSKYQFQSTIQNGCPVDGSGGAAYTSQGVNPGGTVSCSPVSLTRVAVQPESGVRDHDDDDDDDDKDSTKKAVAAAVVAALATKDLISWVLGGLEHGL